MKKLIFWFAFLLLVSLSVSAQGFYFDAGIGTGAVWTKFDGNDVYDAMTADGTKLDEFRLDLGLKVGYGPFNNVPFYFAFEFDGIGHRIYDSSNYIQYNSYLFGPGVIVYPASFIQLGLSLGSSWVYNTNDLGTAMAETDEGVAWNISLATDFGKGNHGFLLGLKYFGAINWLKNLDYDQDTTFLGVFIKYAYRKKNRKSLEQPSLQKPLAAGPDDSLIIVQRTSNYVASAVSMNIVVDGEKVGSVWNGGTFSFTVPNGTHRMEITGGGGLGPSKPILFTADSNEITFVAGYGGLNPSVVMTNVVDTVYTKKGVNRKSTAAGIKTGIEGAVNNTARDLIAKLPQKSTVAVVSISTNDSNIAFFVADELEFQLVDAQKFIIVDRRALEVIRTEQNFQLSGNVSDSSAISIGQMLGANIVITGSITESGPNKRLSLRALDVRTGQIVTMARAEY